MAAWIPTRPFSLFLLRKKLFNGSTGGCLLSTLFAGTGALSYNLAVEGDLHRKLLIVIRTGLADQLVTKHLIFLLLHKLLQGRFIILVVELAHRHIAQDKLADELPGCFHAAV